MSPESLLPALIDLARRAGDAIMAIYTAETIDVTQKSDQSPLTAADLAAHHCIVAGLAEVAPQWPVVSEEDAASFAHRTAEGTFWLIDPLDGTKEFVSRNGEFTVNIALVRDGRPLLGVVHAPALGLTYWGGAGFGAFRANGQGDDALQGEAIRVTPPGTALECRVVASKSHLNDETREFIERLGPVALVQAGSSLKFCRLAEGAADVYPRLAPTCEWDTAAAQAVVEGAGGIVVDLHGQALGYGKPDVLNPSFVAASGAAALPR